jgi:hypothetical protein
VPHPLLSPADATIASCDRDVGVPGSTRAGHTDQLRHRLTCGITPYSLQSVGSPAHGKPAKCATGNDPRRFGSQNTMSSAPSSNRAPDWVSK